MINKIGLLLKEYKDKQVQVVMDGIAVKGTLRHKHNLYYIEDGPNIHHIDWEGVRVLTVLTEAPPDIVVPKPKLIS